MNGSDTYRRYQYQLAFAMELIVKNARNKKDFIALLDYLDDIVLIENPNSENAAITFYQIKSKAKGTISINVILQKEWLEKMCYNLNEISDDNAKSVFVSNTGVSFGNKNIVRETEIVSLYDYVKAQKLYDIDKQVIDIIANTFNVDKNSARYDKIYLLRTTLTLDDYERQLKGELHDFAKELYPELTAVSVDTIFIKVNDMLRKRQAFTFDNNKLVDCEKICEKKGLSSTQLKEIINATKNTQLPEFNSFRKFAIEQMKFEEYQNQIAFRKDYEKFSEEFIMHNEILMNRIFSILDSEEEKLLKIEQDNLVDFCTRIIDDSSEGTASFYITYKKFIVLLYLYRKSGAL